MALALCATLQHTAPGRLATAARPRLSRPAGCSHSRQICRAEPSGDQQEPPPAAAAATEDPPPPTAPSEDDNLRLPREVIQRLRDTVFSFDSFFVTSVENYNAGA